MLPFSLKSFWLTFGVAALACAPALAQTTEYDDKAAVVFAYFAVGNDENPSGSVTEEQFAAHIDELGEGGYNVKPLADIIDVFAAGKSLPDRTIAITFDGADKTVLTTALPLLEDRNLPFTVFIPADKIGTGSYLSWDDLRTLKRNGLVSFGLHPASYSRLAYDSEESTKRQINNSIASIRNELDVDVSLFAYPFGDYDAAYEKIVRDMGFKAAFGQQSGVAYSGENRYALPRFTITERYGDLERFQMTANALPFPAKDVSPANPHLTTLSPAIGFTVPDALGKSLKSISCFSSSDEKPKLEIINTRVELRMESPFSEDRPRINCTLPVAATDGGDPRWRWFGALYTAPAGLLEAEQRQHEKTPTEHAADVSDEVSVE
jgi:peptidoglycan/xylan/chitin deacetylase (PgdA/CDA1 family)